MPAQEAPSGAISTPHPSWDLITFVYPSTRTDAIERNNVAAAALEQSVLESKDKDTLLEMAKALGVKANSRLK